MKNVENRIELSQIIKILGVFFSEAGMLQGSLLTCLQPARWAERSAQNALASFALFPFSADRIFQRQSIFWLEINQKKFLKIESATKITKVTVKSSPISLKMSFAQNCFSVFAHFARRGPFFKCLERFSRPKKHKVGPKKGTFFIWNPFFINDIYPCSALSFRIFRIFHVFRPTLGPYISPPNSRKRAGSSGIWTRDLSHPKRESYP